MEEPLLHQIFTYLLENGSLKLPQNANLPQTDVSLHVLLGDDAYPLKIYLMKSYSKRALSREEHMYNYRLSRARSAFGIIAANYSEPDKADLIVKCICLLHNNIIEKESIYDKSYTSSTPQNASIINIINHYQIIGQHNRLVTSETHLKSILTVVKVAISNSSTFPNYLCHTQSTTSTNINVEFLLV